MIHPESRVLISGASGLIGTALRDEAQRNARAVVSLVRKRRPGQTNAICWNPRNLASGVPPVQIEEIEGIGGIEAVVHLSGANVSRRWTSAYRDEIVRSRVESTRALCKLLAGLQQRPRVLLCASAVGVYGSRGDEVLTESSAPGRGFLAETCRAWEAAAAQASDAGVRVVHLRLGVVLAPGGGALGKMLPVFRAGLGGRIGSGQQWLSWISLRDAVRAILFLMERDDLAGAFNLAAPDPVTNRAFTRALAEAVHRPAMLPVPAAMLRLGFGQMADETILASQRSVPQRLLEAGFRFEDEEIGSTLRALLR